MTEKPVNQHNSEKDANNKEQFKRSTQYKTFNRRDLIRNQSNNFRHRNNRNNFNNRFQNNFDRRNHFENKNPLRRLRKQPLELQGNEEHEGITENIPEDSLVDILAAINSRTSSTETIIVPETQQTNEFFITNPLSLETGSKKGNSKNENKTKKMENQNHSKMKQQEKNLLKQKNNYKQIEEEKDVKSQQEIVQPKIFDLSKKTLPRYQVNILLRGLKFTPTPKRNIIQLKSDIHNYTRKLRLTEFFHNAPENNNLQNLFKTKSHFTPSRNRDRDLDHQIDILNNLDLEGME